MILAVLFLLFVFVSVFGALARVCWEMMSDHYPLWVLIWMMLVIVGAPVAISIIIINDVMRW